MLTLYYLPMCPFCLMVLDFAKENNIEFELKDISASPETKEELVQKTGKGQVPFLVDAENNVEMHESADIIEYLKNRK